MEGKKNIILITHNFPYSPGEEFLETEVDYYQFFEKVELTILPSRSTAELRKVNKNIIIDDYIINHQKYPTYKTKLKYLCKSLSSSFFYKEIFSVNFFSLKIRKAFLHALWEYHKFYELFDKYFENKKNLENTTVYTYWNIEVTFALQSLKNKYNYKLVSRIHGYDIYQERMPNNYMPFKKVFTKNIDKIYTITESANNYLHLTYNFSHDILKTSRLGVKDNNIITQPTEKNILHIISCSRIVSIKQIDKIIYALKSIANNMKNYEFIWTHMGDGPLNKEISKLAEDELTNIPNVKYTFSGFLSNSEVYEFYRKNNVDVFINTSLSEGVPVSIMEAMSCHVPIIAPDVGGVKDMIENQKSGLLLSETCEIDEIVHALKNIKFFKSSKVRIQAYNIFLEKFNAEKNYKEFINEIVCK